MADLGRGLCYGMPVLLYAGLIFILSSLSEFHGELPFFSGYDGLLHLGEYYLLGWLLMRWLLSKRSTFWSTHARPISILIGILYGLADEWHQSFVPGREATLRDVFFDSLGVVAAALTYRTIRRKIPFLERLDRAIERRLARLP